MKVNTYYSRGCKVHDADKPDNISVSSCSCNKLNVFDWLNDLPEDGKFNDIAEIRFKNTRKGYFHNVNKLNLKQGDVVAVEASPGHDIGVVSLTGDLVTYQMKKNRVSTDLTEMKKIYRKAKPADILKWTEAISLEHLTMIKTREIAGNLNLNMKIGDVEYQGDNTKAIFYYIADERVDFRELIKILADRFKIKIEMKQIGARQEAGRIGAIGPCGRELCCSTWMTNFISVSTNAARDQELSLNPQKLAGQCSKLKCCLNYEYDTYLDALKGMPNTNIELHTEDGPAFFQKTDALRGIMWYSFEKNSAVNLTPVPVERVKEIIALNKKGEKVAKLVGEAEQKTINGTKKIEPAIEFENSIGQDSITRFDSQKKKSKHKNKKKKRNIID